MRVNWKTVLPPLLGAALLIVPAAYILNKSQGVFADDCRKQCEVARMDYKVRAIPRPYGSVDYPAECVCVMPAEKRWWEVWK